MKRDNDSNEDANDHDSDDEEKDDSIGEDLMSCLIRYKYHPSMEEKCRAGIEHHQLVSSDSWTFFCVLVKLITGINISVIINTLGLKRKQIFVFRFLDGYYGQMPKSSSIHSLDYVFIFHRTARKQSLLWVLIRDFM